jgi:hypothetical protein
MKAEIRILGNLGHKQDSSRYFKCKRKLSRMSEKVMILFDFVIGKLVGDLDEVRFSGMMGKNII